MGFRNLQDISGIGEGGELSTAQETALADVGTLTSGSVVFSNGTKLTEDNTNFFWDDTNNRLGIGTSSPSSLLHVKDGAKASAGEQVRLNIGTDDAQTFELSVRAIGNVTAADRYIDIQSIEQGVGGRILALNAAGGNVGIGTATPTAKLEITSSDANAARINPFGASAGNTGEIQFMELVASGTNYVGFKAADAITTNIVWTLPDADGAADEFLQTDGSGNLTFAEAAGGITFEEVTGTSKAGVVDTGYITNNVALVTVTLPDTAELGSVIRIVGSGTGGWKLAQNAGETIHFLGVDTTTGTGGSLASSTRYDAVELVCIVADTEWVEMSSSGNITIV